MLTVNQIVEGEIETIAFGGEGILRFQKFVVFIPFTAIGDKIACRITEVRRSFAKGTLIHIRHPGINRTAPRCPYFGICGGCQLQHLNEEAQLSYKKSAPADALKRIGHLSFPAIQIIPASNNWAYRRHVTFHLKPKNGGFEAGYIGQDNHSLVVVKTCPIFNEPEDPILHELQQLVGKLSNPEGEEGRVTLLKNHRGQYILSFHFKDKFDIRQKTFQAALQHSPVWAGILLQKPNENIVLGDPFCEQQLDGLTFRFSPQTFIQNHPEQSAKIYRRMMQLAARFKHPHILDLYCGFGMTSLLLAKQNHLVTGIECNPQAIEFAKENAELNQLKNVWFLHGDVEKILPHWLKSHHAELIIVNPPRQGLSKKVVQMLIKAKPQAMIYISCMPSTLARDLNLLCEYYEFKEGFAYDMFPQTAHVETMVYLERKG